ncbi:MAG: SpoIIE family protein phosphatase [Bacillota bacterium]|nr:SpoIIE family protein phosphatase [Bacillota bacterium]
MRIDAAAVTHVGLKRENNEDNFYINGVYKKDVTEDICICGDTKRRKSYTYAVCDGVGGVDFGELASLHSVEELVNFDGKDLADRFADFIQAANDRICLDIKANGGKRIGSTAALLFITKKRAGICNIGDSRVYLFHEDELKQISHDHTRRQRMIDSGEIVENSGEPAVKDHMLTQFLGVFPTEFKLEPHIVRNIRIKKKDIFLLCSDGLTDMVSDESLREIIRDNAAESSEKIVNELIHAAIQNGGRDNITAIVAKVI